MPRPIGFTPVEIAERALPSFWGRGFGGTSVDDLTKCIGASRQAIYNSYRDKRALLLACIDVYRRTIVDPAFAPVERPGAGLREIEGYFEVQIAAAEQAGLPGCGCLMANLATEAAAHDPDVAAAVQAHLERLRAGFSNALKGARKDDCVDVGSWASLLTTTAQGLWSLARVSRNAEELRQPVAALLALIEGAIAR